MNYYKRHLGDYAKDTRALSVYEHGVYTLLLDYYYSEETPIRNEDAEAIIRPSTAKEKASLQKVLARYFKPDGDFWRHSYADRVISEASEKSAKASESAAKRWKKESERSAKEHPEDHAKGMRTHSERSANGDASHKPLAISQETSKSKDEPPIGGLSPATAAPLPPPKPKPERPKAGKPLSVADLVSEGADPQHAADWMAVRARKKAPLTATAWEAVKREARAAGIKPAEAVKVCAERGWQGFNASWNWRGDQTPPQASPPSQPPRAVRELSL